MLFADVFGNEGTIPPAQIVWAVPKLNVGVIIGLTVTVNVVVNAHKPAVGVNVYTPEVLLLIVDGFQVPVMPSSEVAGNVGTDAPAQMVSDDPKLNVGVMFGFTVTLNIVDVAH